MSIAGTVLQFLTITALRENETLAGDAVIGSPIDPISQDFQQILRPTVAVFTGEDNRQNIQGRDIGNADREIELSLQIYCPAEVSVSVNGAAVRVSTRGEGGDVVADILARQIERALIASDTPAAALWRVLVLGVGSITSAPFLFETQDVRIFVTEMNYVCKVLSDPDFGQGELTGFWADAVDAMEADPDYAPIGAWIRAEIIAPDFMTAGRIAQAQISTTDGAAVELGIKDIEDPSAPTTQVTILDDEAPTDVVVNEANAEAVDPTE